MINLLFPEIEASRGRGSGVPGLPPEVEWWNGGWDQDLGTGERTGQPSNGGGKIATKFENS